MPELPNDPSPKRDNADPYSGPITKPLRSTLPDPSKLEKFYTETLPHLVIPRDSANQSSTLDLDTMLALVRPKNPAHAARILTVALKYWRSIDVSASDQTHEAPSHSPMQEFALGVSVWASTFLRCVDLDALAQAKGSWDLTWLKDQLEPVIKYHTYCNHVIRVAEDLSQQIRELGGYDSLSSEDKAIVDTLAPAGSSIQEIKNSWVGEPISAEISGAANTARMQPEQARLLAVAYLRSRSGQLRFIEDDATAWKVALEMATEALSKPGKPPS